LPLLVKAAQGHTAKRTCFACHNQALPLLAVTAAGARDFKVPPGFADKQADFIAAFLAGNRANYRLGKGQGGQADTAGQALFALELAGRHADATTEAVVEYLLKYNSDLDHWRTRSYRPPSEASPFSTTYFALRGLRTWGTKEQKERIGARIDRVRRWLVKAPAGDTEDRVFRLLALHEAGAGNEERRVAVRELVRTQRADGGWGQLERLPSDAYATGSALVAARWAGGLSTAGPVYRRGLAFLLTSQRPDGSWLVRSRSRPFQLYYESGFPHGKDQFISAAASGYAVAALVLALPPARSAGEPRRPQ
jgi:hypothetical protein